MPKEFALKVFLYGLGLVTLFFYSTLVDPFNSPKAWILDISAAWLLGYLIYDFRGRKISRDEKIALFVIGGFILAMLIALCGTSYLFTGFFGSYGRRTGFISYLALALFTVAGMRLVRLKNLARTDLPFLVTGSIASIYGLFQHYHHDFVNWNNPFNPLISTVGNPDFASAILGVIAVLCFGIGINSYRKLPIRIWALIIFIISVADVKFTASTQGLLISILGVGFIILVWVYQRNKVLGHIFLVGGVAVGTAGILGILQIGPLTKYLFKSSVTYRGDYWRAGINMFLHHPILGVGLDRYGENYRQYRDVLATVRRGPDLVSNAAHNVFIQLAATGGIFVLIAYVVLTAFIIWRGVVVLKNSRGVSQLAAATVFAGWIAYFAQSIISIDNLGVAIWGWVLGGIVIGISFVPEESLKGAGAQKGEVLNKSRKAISPEFSYVLSTILAMAMLILVIPLILGDKSVVISSALQLPANLSQDTPFKNEEERPLHNIFVDPASILVIAGKLAEGSIHNGKADPLLLDRSESLLNDYLKQDRNNYQFTSTLCEIYEQTGTPTKAIALRKLNTALDPYNTANWLQYGMDLKAAGDKTLFKYILSKIDSIDPKGADAQKAHQQLV